MATEDDRNRPRSKFPPLFWLVVVFEFFERGSYYGVMSVLSVYMTDHLKFAKTDVGLIKGTIQPLLYFLPILSGALADRFGYRRTLMVAFSLLGGGYLLASQATEYTPMFLFLVVMGFGAGCFKPVISGTIARCTDKTNSTLGFGVFYWSINLGAFLVPTILVPYLKKYVGWDWVLIAAAIGTGALLLPTIFFYREPPLARGNGAKDKLGLIQTLANAFEIIYSPFVLISRVLQGPARILLILLFLLIPLGFGGYLYGSAAGPSRPFVLPFIGLLFVSSMVILRLEASFKAAPSGRKAVFLAVTVGVLGVVIWTLPHLSVFARILSSVIAVTPLSLYVIDFEDLPRFRDHFRFLLLIFIYAGFWVLYFQMMDSVLWYVKDYVDASSLNDAVNGFFSRLGITMNWKFDVEHVTSINAGTIILLQLVVSHIVKNFKALPTMIVGIGFGTAGMAILAINTDIWVFVIGLIIFSIGEMTAHPKFISYVGQAAPQSRVAMYMGYLFLYGVIGSSIGSVVGANLYVKFVDEMNQPRTLWLIFTGIGVATIVGLILYNRFLAWGDEKPRSHSCET